MPLEELAWVELLKRKVPKAKGLSVGIGDDCACVQLGAKQYLLKSDLYIEDIHFKPKTTSFRTIGMLAVARVLSDFAACGGRPLYLGISIGVSRTITMKNLAEILAGVMIMSRRYKFSFVGGDTSRAQKLFLDVWGLGQADKFISRSSAKNGDYIFLSGRLGLRPFNKIFQPRIKEAKYLVSHFKINAMIDISDGVIIDLFRILQESKKGAILYAEQIPLTKGKSDLYRGEDYELLFTVDKREKHISYLKKKFYYIGRITEQKYGYMIKEGNLIKPVAVKGYTHF